MRYNLIGSTPEENEKRWLEAERLEQERIEKAGIEAVRHDVKQQRENERRRRSTPKFIAEHPESVNESKPPRTPRIPKELLPPKEEKESKPKFDRVKAWKERKEPAYYGDRFVYVFKDVKGPNEPLETFKTRLSAIQPGIRGTHDNCLMWIQIHVNPESNVPTCVCCGENHLQFLSIEHLEGGGKRHRSRHKGKAKQFYEEIISDPEPQIKFSILCMNCNWAKGVYKMCPHEFERRRRKQEEERGS